MNLDDLRSVQSKERQKDSLPHLRDTFYEDVGEYVEELKAERERVADRADDPFSNPEVGRLTDEIETAEEVVEAIYERRMGKLVKRASLAAAGMPADDEGLTAEEQELFEDLVDRIERNKSHVLDVLAGDAETDADAATDEAGEASEDPRREQPDAGGPAAGSGSPPSDDAAPADADDSSFDRPPGEASTVSAADVMGGDGPGTGGPDAGTEPSDPGTGAEPTESTGPDSSTSGPGGDAGVRDAPGHDSSADPDAGASDDDALADELGEDRTTVRITEDVGEILGVDDREYELSAEDVVTLPETNAAPLIERNAAERLE